MNEAKNFTDKIKSLKSILFCIVATMLFLPSITFAMPEWGVYTDQDSDPLAIVNNLENSLGKKFDNHLYYSAIGDDFELTLANNIKSQGKHLQLVLEFWDPSAGSSQPGFRLKNITNGDHDKDIIRWANSLKAFGDKIYLTPMSEMNGDWLVWSGTTNGNSPTDYIPAWQHIHNIFNLVGTTNVKWVWSPNCVSVPDIPSNDAKVYYPGDAYVDYIGVNGYNFGPPEDNWLSFHDIFMPFYQKTKQITQTPKPIIIGEMGSSEIGGDKAAWINEMFRELSTNFPRIEQVYWFNVNKEKDWRIESSQASLNAFKSNFNAKAVNINSQGTVDSLVKGKNVAVSSQSQKNSSTTNTTDSSSILSKEGNHSDSSNIFGEVKSITYSAKKTLLMIILVIVMMVALMITWVSLHIVNKHIKQNYSQAEIKVHDKKSFLKSIFSNVDLSFAINQSFIDAHKEDKGLMVKYKNHIISCTLIIVIFAVYSFVLLMISIR